MQCGLSMFTVTIIYRGCGLTYVSQISSRQLYQRACACTHVRIAMYARCARACKHAGHSIVAGRQMQLACVAVVKRRIIRFRLYPDMCDATEPLCAQALFSSAPSSANMCVFPQFLRICVFHLRAVPCAPTIFYILLFTQLC